MRSCNTLKQVADERFFIYAKENGASVSRSRRFIDELINGARDGVLRGDDGDVHRSKNSDSPRKNAGRRSSKESSNSQGSNKVSNKRRHHLRSNSSRTSPNQKTHRAVFGGAVFDRAWRPPGRPATAVGTGRLTPVLTFKPASSARRRRPSDQRPLRPSTVHRHAPTHHDKAGHAACLSLLLSSMPKPEGSSRLGTALA